MADVTINQLTSQTPADNDIFPFSTTGITPATYKASLAQIKTALGLATVATTGSYNDLIDKPNTGLGGLQLFTTNGTFTVPTNVTKIKVICIGGGGGAPNGTITPGTPGGSSSITGINIIGGGGGAGGSGTNGVGGAGGSSTGSLKVLGSTGNSGINGGGSGGARAGGSGVFIYGLQQFGTGGTSVNFGAGGGGGGCALGIATVTPGSTLTVNVGQGGGGGGGGSNGAVFIEW